MTAYEHNADVVVIGAGVVGNAIARELARYDVSVVLLEREADVAWGTTKANTALCTLAMTPSGTSKAQFNVTERHAPDLRRAGVQFQNTGSLVVAHRPTRPPARAPGARQGQQMPGLEIISESATGA